jgi:hypothetical protein
MHSWWDGRLLICFYVLWSHLLLGMGRERFWKKVSQPPTYVTEKHKCKMCYKALLIYFHRIFFCIFVYVVSSRFWAWSFNFYVLVRTSVFMTSSGSIQWLYHSFVYFSSYCSAIDLLISICLHTYKKNLQIRARLIRNIHKYTTSLNKMQKTFQNLNSGKRVIHLLYKKWAHHHNKYTLYA